MSLSSTPRPPDVVYVLALLALASAAPAAACKCNQPTLAEAVAHSDVVALATVGPVRIEADGTASAPVTFDDVLRGPAARAHRVHWREPDGGSCDFVALRPGRWQLFLVQLHDGRLSIRTCDANSRPLGKLSAKKARAALMAHMKPVTTEAEAIAAAARAAGPALVASYVAAASKIEGGAGGVPSAPDLARADRAVVTKDKDGSYRVRWSQFPPSGTSIDAEVRVQPDGTAEVLRASASFSPD